ncbi:MAG: glycosyltransferase family 61 protein [Bacteroidales bacterium]|jgi:hypothetical protein|nr:glycosyltransferase family 61 protein [Bacteroidales bacterium]
MPIQPLIIEKGIIQPSFGKSRRNSFFRVTVISAGVLTKAGIPVGQSKTVINERESVRPLRINPSETEIKYLDADAIYFCIPQNHFGHVLTGTMAFAHILPDGPYKNHKVVFTAFPPDYEAPCEAIKILLKHLGVKEEDIITVDEYTQFRSVVIVEPSLRCVRLSRFRKRLFAIDREFADTFRAISARFTDRKYPDKVYFSRGKISHRPIMFEDKIERIFEKNGYEIFYPEQLPLDEQIKLVANANYYACLQGTLEHHSLFMKDNATMITISRKSGRTERQVLINQLQKNIRHIYLRGNIQPFGDKISPNIVGITGHFIPFFDEHHFVYSADDWKLTDQEINDYVEKCSWRDIPLPKNILRRILRYFLRKHQKSVE